MRESGEEKLLVINHFYAGETDFTLPDELVQAVDEMEGKCCYPIMRMRQI
ncbi:hypothetical protein ACEQPO_05930 [Bacillus sp. SL00103]